MTAAMAIPGNTAETFLVHFFGTGLADDRYVVERYRAVSDGVDAPPDGIAMCQVDGVVNAKRGKGRPWNRLA